jgi:hypothetical protein
VNRLPVEIKAMIEGALAELGGMAWLVRAAKKKPEAFLSLVGKLVPRVVDVQGVVTHAHVSELPESRLEQIATGVTIDQTESQRVQ